MKYFFILSLLVSCKVDPKFSLTDYTLQEQIPEGWPKPVYTFSNNVLSKEKFNLGRALFYDQILSIDSGVSCASCHQDFAAFANAGHDFSHGIKDKNGIELQGNRNTPALFNLTWMPYFMHDGGINHIEVQPLGPITNTLEMGESIAHVVQKLQRSSRYKTLFGKDEINSQNMLKAMAQFMAMLYSNNSKYDRVKRGEKKFSFTLDEANGELIFNSHCSSCHTPPLFTDFKFRNNGLKINTLLNDSGRARITNLPSDKYKYKTPSLRNIEKTAPYMHDGRLNTLEECINHYTSPFENTINLDETLPKNGMALSADEKKYLISFLKTLTDTAFINNKNFKDPKYN